VENTSLSRKSTFIVPLLSYIIINIKTVKGDINMDINPNCYPYPSKRTLVYGKNGMVATSQHLAAQAGLDILKKGGNAVDAAVATAACLTVVEPTSNGVGGDAFVIVWMK